MAEQRVQFKVFRYKQGQAAPTYRVYEVSVGRRTTVLKALEEIRRTQDPTLAFRYSCHHASCGTCGVKVNGQEVLACVTNVLELGTNPVVVEPLNNAPLIGDLVVDIRDFFARYTPAGMPLLRESEFLPDSQVPEGVAYHMRYENCIECGLCVSACPITGSDPAYLGPAALAAAWRVVKEPRGADVQAVLNWVDHEHGCWRCHQAFECSEVCPSNVDPAGAIMAMRGELTRRKLRRLFGVSR